MERYRVRRHKLVEQIRQAILLSGGSILSEASPTSAPFEYEILDADGRHLLLVCYAFTANRYRQRNRPDDEHRFQVKYGSDFSRYHELFLDPSRRVVTLMFGVHDELGLFVAVDPRMHNPTWFSRSVEFKTADLESALATGWHGWERERSWARRKRLMPLENLQTETLIAFTPEHLLRFVDFEARTSGLDTGERLYASDTVQARIAGSIDVGEPRRHPFELRMGLTAHEIFGVIEGSFRLEAAVRGSVAEHHLQRHLEQLPSIRDTRRNTKDSPPDFTVRFRDRIVRLECKNVLRRSDPQLPRVDFQKTRASKQDPCSRYYAATQFEILAACLHPITGSWEFRFCETARLAPHRKCAGRLSERVTIEPTSWSEQLTPLLERL